jgi:hypothetical protein
MNPFVSLSAASSFLTVSCACSRSVREPNATGFDNRLLHRSRSSVMLAIASAS